MENLLKVSVIISFVILIISGCWFKQSSQAIADRNTVMKKINDGALIVDVRTIEEYSEHHLDGALNIPLADIERRIGEFGSKERPIVVYCRSGNRSSKAKAILEKKGFKDITNGGGLEDMLKLKNK